MGNMDKKPQITKENVKALFDSPYVRVADLQYAPGKHYYDATRRTMEDMVAVKPEEEFENMLPDAVSCIVILAMPGEEPKLLLSYEFRYPAGQYLLSVPAGLIDEGDKGKADAVLVTTVREIKEETGLEVRETDTVTVVNPLVFSTPGMTDECNALVCAVLHPTDLSLLSQEGAVGSEQFDGFCLLTKAQAMEVLRSGRDERGKYYPLYTWAALMYFVSDMWQPENR
nr:NUDIX hydrolase [uncultured Acetatifactor sp.]